MYLTCCFGVCIRATLMNLLSICNTLMNVSLALNNIFVYKPPSVHILWYWDPYNPLCSMNYSPTTGTMGQKSITVAQSLMPHQCVGKASRSWRYCWIFLFFSHAKHTFHVLTRVLLGKILSFPTSLCLYFIFFSFPLSPAFLRWLLLSICFPKCLAYGLPQYIFPI